MSNDLEMEATDPIRPRPEEIMQMNEDFNGRVTSEVSRQVSEAESRHAAEVETARAEAAGDGERRAGISALQAMVDGNPGDTVDALKFRGAVQDMILAIHNGAEKPVSEFVSEAMKLSEARIQAIAATSGDTSGETIAEVHADNRGGGYQTFAGAYMGALFDESKRLGEKLDGEKLTGSPEMEYASSLLDKPGMRDEFQRLSAEAGSRARVVPFPMAMLRPDAQFAETRAAAVVAGDLRREPTYRRDALVPFYRPNNVLAGLGVANPIIDNDITLPR